MKCPNSNCPEIRTCPKNWHPCITTGLVNYVIHYIWPHLMWQSVRSIWIKTLTTMPKVFILHLWLESDYNWTFPFHIRLFRFRVNMKRDQHFTVSVLNLFNTDKIETDELFSTENAINSYRNLPRRQKGMVSRPSGCPGWQGEFFSVTAFPICLIYQLDIISIKKSIRMYAKNKYETQ